MNRQRSLWPPRGAGAFGGNEPSVRSPFFLYNGNPDLMDNLTHTAVGLFLSRAGLHRWTPRSTAILLLAANAPDIDILAASRGSLNYLHYHRHITHSLIAMPVMAL